MKTTPVHSFGELEKGISQAERSFLLLYKSGAEQSDCALKRLSDLDNTDTRLFTANVNEVRDIHPRLNISTAPSLVIFDHSKVINIIKGCQSEAAYDAVFRDGSRGPQ